MLGVPACSWQQVKPWARSHEARCDGEKEGGEQEQVPSSNLWEQQRVPWSEMGLLSKIHALAMQKKSREGLSLSAIEQPLST